MSLPCDDTTTLGWYYKDGTIYYYGYYTSSSTYSNDHSISFKNLPKGTGNFDNDAKYCYHADSNGNFIEWCPSAGSEHKNIEFAKQSHGIE